MKLDCFDRLDRLNNGQQLIRFDWFWYGQQLCYGLNSFGKTVGNLIFGDLYSAKSGHLKICRCNNLTSLGLRTQVVDDPLRWICCTLEMVSVTFYSAKKNLEKRWIKLKLTPKKPERNPMKEVPMGRSAHAAGSGIGKIFLMRLDKLDGLDRLRRFDWFWLVLIDLIGSID
jgi:hypothetical protein